MFVLICLCSISN